MGVSGAGKSTLGKALAAQLNCPFVEGDTLHPPANIAKMAAGIPLDDADRQPFLDAVAKACADADDTGVVVSCSALKRAYRDLIRARAKRVTFVWPMLSREQLLGRLAHREHHFMPASLLDSQLAVLEPPTADEAAIVVDGTRSTHDQVAQALAALQARRAPAQM